MRGKLRAAQHGAASLARPGGSVSQVRGCSSMHTYSEPARSSSGPERLHSAARLMALQLYRSNCMERLADALAGAVRRPLSNVLAPECIAVPSAGMERWLALELATRLGVWANPAFPFPGKLVESVLADVLHQPVHGEAYGPLRVQFA